MEEEKQNNEHKYTCTGCGSHVSWFWYRIGIGCDSEGNHGQVAELCDVCWLKFVSILREKP